MYLGNLPIIGHLGRDPELHFTPAGRPVTNFSVAVNRHAARTGSNGEAVKETYWFRCAAWDKQAEVCNQFLKKGSKVFIEGRLTADQATGGPRVWTKQDGTPQASFELTIVTIKFLDVKSDSVPEGGSGGGEAASLEAPEDDIPF